LDLGARIFKLRTAANLTQRYVGQLCGVSEGEVSRWENGERCPTEKHLQALFRALHITDPTVQAQWAKAAGRNLQQPAGSSGAASDATGELQLSGEASFHQAIVEALGDFASPIESFGTLSRLSPVIDQVWGLWHNTRPDLPAPERGPGHHVRMIEFLRRDFTDCFHRLKDAERELLLLGILLHDIGVPAGTRFCDPHDLLLDYPSLSIRFIQDHKFELTLSDEKLYFLEDICREHRSSRKILFDASGPYSSRPLRRAKALLALIRIADIADVSPSRILLRPPLDLLSIDPPRPGDAASRIYRDTYRDWQRSLFLRRIYRKRETIIGELGNLPDFRERDIQLLKENLQHDLQFALDAVRDLLASEWKCLLVSVRIEPSPTAAPDSGQVRELKRRLAGRIGASRSPNARQVVEIVLHALRARLGDTSGKALFGYIRAELPHQLQIRAFQAPLERLCNELQGVVASSIPASDKVSTIAGIVGDYEKRSEEALAGIECAAREFLYQFNDITLFGYSDCVSRALAALPAEWKASVRVTVLEMRNKTVYRDDGAIEYADCMQYLYKLPEVGFQQIRLATDIAVASVLREAASRSDSSPAALIGVNAIHRPTGNALSTIGTQTVARIASSLGLPLIAIAEKSKITETLGETSRKRRNYWFTADQQVSAYLESRGIQLHNPMEDELLAEFIHRYLTDEGPCTPADIVAHPLIQSVARPYH
jgi:transcriptional regulator with XRE-family HTH domain